MLFSSRTSAGIGEEIWVRLSIGSPPSGLKQAVTENIVDKIRQSVSNRFINTPDIMIVGFAFMENIISFICEKIKQIHKNT
jgi:hypothetical protein